MGPETNRQVGFLGAGAIAEVFVRRLLDCRLIAPDRILVYDPNEGVLSRLAGSCGVRTVASNREVVADSVIVFIAVPPMAVLPVLREVAPALRDDHLVFSLAAGVPIARMEDAIGKPVPLNRTIPNTPAWVGRGMTPFCAGSHESYAKHEDARALSRAFGRIAEVPEEHMAIATALTAACQVVAGAGQLVLESKRSPEALTLTTSLRTLGEPAVKKLFAQAVDSALGKVLAAEATLRSAGNPGS